MPIICPLCAATLPAAAVECPNCGAIVAPRVEIKPSACPGCQQVNPTGARFCNQCGARLDETEALPTEIAPPSVETVNFAPDTPAENLAKDEIQSSTSDLSPIATGTPQNGELSTPLISRTHTIGWSVWVGVIILGIFCCVGMAVLSGGALWAAFLPLQGTETATSALLPPTWTSQPSAPPATEIPLSPTVKPSQTPSPSPTNTPKLTLTPTTSQPSGKIVFSCQMDGVDRDQVCITNADGSGWRQLTDNNKHNWYASLSPDGTSVVYSSNLSGNYEIYEISMSGGNPIRLTSRLGGKPYAPEISPDGKAIVFTYDAGGKQSIWVMNRDGANPHRVSPGEGWDPSWSPDGTRILFASRGSGSAIQLFTVRMDGTGLKKITEMSGLVGRSDWSPNGEWIATYAGKYGQRSLYIMKADGSNSQEYHFNPTSAAPSFSPDSQWVAFTGYIDHPTDFNTGCEIYIVRVSDPTDVRRLTRNSYCDWQPRWGP